MRTTSIGTLTLALVLGAGALAAQPPRDGRPPRDPADSSVHGRRGPGGPGGPQAMLLRGITLTDEQQQRIESLRSAEREQTAAQRAGGQRDDMRTAMDAARTARERGDTAAANAQMAKIRVQMDARRDRDIAELRGVLTTDQRRTFDANVAELKQRDAERRERGDNDGPRREPRDGSR